MFTDSVSVDDIFIFHIIKEYYRRTVIFSINENIPLCGVFSFILEHFQLKCFAFQAVRPVVSRQKYVFPLN